MNFSFIPFCPVISFDTIMLNVFHVRVLYKILFKDAFWKSVLLNCCRCMCNKSTIQQQSPWWQLTHIFIYAYGRRFNPKWFALHWTHDLGVASALFCCLSYRNDWWHIHVSKLCCFQWDQTIVQEFTSSKTMVKSLKCSATSTFINQQQQQYDNCKKPMFN